MDLLAFGMGEFREEVVEVMSDGEKHTRSPFERMHQIHQAIQEGRLPNGSSLSLARVKLCDCAARLARERRWHPAQEIRELNAKGTKV